MDLKSMPKETASELLLFLSESENFESVRELLVGDVTTEEVRGLLREIATQLQKEVFESSKEEEPLKNVRLTKEAKEIISYLSPHEERSLLSAFGIIEKPKSLKKEKELPKRRTIPSFYNRSIR